MDIKKVCVLGAGLMGSGIAQVCAEGQFKVSLRDVENNRVQSGIEKIKTSLSKFTAEGKFTKKAASEILSRIEGTTDLRKAVENADVVIEAVPENLELKKKVFEEADKICPESVIFLSNTSTFSITELASSTKRPEKFIGAHFISPVPEKKIVEICRGLRTSDSTVELTKKFLKKTGNEFIELKDSPGAIINKIVLADWNNAIQLIMDGLSTPEDIDKVIKIGLGRQQGHFEELDCVGLDIALACSESMFEQTGDPRFKPCPLLRQMVKAGYLGKKTGKGFYDYR